MTTPFYLKIDTDCFAINDDKRWIDSIKDRYSYAFITNRWGYTKNADRIISLEDWADQQELFKTSPRLNLKPNEHNTIVHSRIISFFFVGNTRWTNEMSGLCWNKDHYDLPVPSHDTFLWYCAQRGKYPYKTYKFKQNGFNHFNLSKAKKQIDITTDSDLIDLSNSNKAIDTNKINIHIGCGRKKYDNWYNTDKKQLDITQTESWTQNKILKNSIQKILAEHVFEHLSDNDRILSIQNFYKFLIPGGFIRIAVPDGFHPDPEYIDAVKVGGSGKSAYDHKFLYTYISLTNLFKQYGFDSRLLEFFDENGSFHQYPWKIEDGFIRRSYRFDRRNKYKPLSYTSLIIDFIKPQSAIC